MKYKKLLLAANFTHFKIFMDLKMKNIYGDKIDYFDFRFTFKANGIFRDDVLFTLGDILADTLKDIKNIFMEY